MAKPTWHESKKETVIIIDGVEWTPKVIEKIADSVCRLKYGKEIKMTLREQFENATGLTTDRCRNLGDYKELAHNYDNLLDYCKWLEAKLRLHNGDICLQK